MSDFLVSLTEDYSGRSLLEILAVLYGDTGVPSGEVCDLPWGAVAVTHERLACGRNVVRHRNGVIAWVGDLLLGDGEADPQEVASHMERLRFRRDVEPSDPFFERLNGTFAIVSADKEQVCVITDLLNSIPVYCAVEDGKVIALGTHPDAVAGLGKLPSSIDLASAGEFLNRGTPLFPYTIHSNVNELAPGSFFRLPHAARRHVGMETVKYWSPPKEDGNGHGTDDFARELTTTLRAAVERRCRGHKVVVKLSGGLDSRVILASVPASTDCTTVTFCDEINREARTARRVAQVYARPWRSLFREDEYLANNFVKGVRLSGCEHMWIHAHAIGLVDDIVRDSATCVLDGQWSNAFLRLYFAADIARIGRLGGLLPARFGNIPFNYGDHIVGFCSQSMNEDVVTQMRSRRLEYQEKNHDPSRTSLSEWLDNYPVSQEAPLSTWLVERRLMPIRMVFLDRQVIELGYRCPLRFKFGDALFNRATAPILGPGRRIPNANDGVCPCSGHALRLAQRAVRKLQDQTVGFMKVLGRRPRVEHSWHDYETYWRKSEGLAKLIQEYGPNLEAFDGVLFKGRGRDLLTCRDLSWEYRCRLLQLGIWRSLYRDYRQVVCSKRRS